MKLWVDAQLSPALARWIADQFGLEAFALRDSGLRDAKDRDAFAAARQAGAIVLTKDSDFGRLLRQHGPPPRVLWLRCGNTSNAHLFRILMAVLPQALRLLESSDSLVEITDPW